MSASRVSRRTFLVGGAAAVTAGAAGVALVEARVVPGRGRLNRLLGLEGSNGVIPATTPGHRVDGSFHSTHRATTVHWSVSYPPGSAVGAPLPVLVSLHGRGSDHESSFSALGLDHYLAQAVAQGTPKFAIASVDGGDTYWHARRDGTDSGAMVVRELLPLLAARGLDVSRLGYFGWSMGGYGSLLLASTPGYPKVKVVATLSAALWTRAGDTAQGAFDDAADYAAHDVFARRDNLRGVPIRMDCGRDDPFIEANQAYAAGLPQKPAGGWEPGQHTDGYWRRMAPAQLAFVGEHL